MKEGEKLGVGSLALAGGLAGCAYWGPVYPADIVKSKIQVDSFQNPEYKGAIDCFIKVRLLFEGLSAPSEDKYESSLGWLSPNRRRLEFDRGRLPGCPVL